MSAPDCITDLNPISRAGRKVLKLQQQRNGSPHQPLTGLNTALTKCSLQATLQYVCDFKTDSFARWLDQLRDAMARARILVRIERLAEGNQGITSFVGSGVTEMKIDHGPGYRV